MSTEQNNPDAILDRALLEIRDEAMDPAVVEAAAGRVWRKLSAADEPAVAAVGHIRGCADYQSLFSAYLAGNLSAARTLLLEDHTRECVACRKALQAFRSRKVQTIEAAGTKRPMIRSSREKWAGWSSRARWAIAAAVVIGVGLAAPGILDRIVPAPAGSRAVVQSVDGFLYRVSEAGSAPALAGSDIGDAEGIRTAKGSGAIVRLTDGSLIEMRERSELSLSRKWRGSTIHLERGSIIVQAARQRSGHLYVATKDCLVSVKGTTFAVNRGTKGSRVSVIEGEVRVEQDGQEKVLHPGDQATTSANLEMVPVKDEIAWSRNLSQYLAVLGELGALQKRIEAMPGPALRYSTDLLRLVPAGTVIYAAIPNIGNTLSEARRLFEERMQQSEALREWWQQKRGVSGPKLDEIIDRVRTFSDYLGNEIALAVTMDRERGWAAPVVLADVKRPDFQAFLTNEVGKFNSAAQGPALEILQHPASAGSSNHNAILFYLRDGVVAVSSDAAKLNEVASLMAQPGAGAFLQSGLGSRIAEAYRDGAGWLFSVDMEQILADSVHHGKPPAPPGLRLADVDSGLADVKDLMVERREIAGRTEHRAVLSFQHARRGIASWLAAPGPMGAMDFISPDASVAASFVFKNPRLMMDDLFAMMQTTQTDAANCLSAFESATGVSVQGDLAGALGGEISVALDGPILPLPSWKVAVEVYDPAKLQATIERLLAAFQKQPMAAKINLRLDKEESGGRVFYTLHGADAPIAAHYVFVDGYFVVAPTRALLAQAIQNRRNGYTLARSHRFVALLPHDGYANFSALIYQNLGSALGPLADQLKSLGGFVGMTEAQRQSIEAFAANTEPSLVYAYGEPDRIRAGSTGSFFGMNLDTLAGPLMIPQLLGGRMRPRPAP